MRLSCAFLLSLMLTACNWQEPTPPITVPSKDTTTLIPDKPSVHIVVNDSLINTKDVYSIIEPVWFGVNIYDSEKDYRNDLAKFSVNQRYVFAIEWYMAEVNNGGHDQFFWNSTGIVWKDALEGFKIIGMKKNYEILQRAAAKLGGDPSMDRKTRQQQLDDSKAEFDKEDDQFYDSDKNPGIEQQLWDFIDKHRSDFYFNGMVNKG